MISKTEVREWLLHEVFPFDSDLKNDDIGLIVDDKTFIKVIPHIYKYKIAEDNGIPYDLDMIMKSRFKFKVKFSKYCYYLSVEDSIRDITIIFTIDSKSDGLFGVTISNKLITQISTCLNIIDTLNESIKEVRDDYYYIDSIVVDISNENIFINYINNAKCTEINHAYNDLQFIRTIQKECTPLYEIFARKGFLGNK